MCKIDKKREKKYIFNNRSVSLYETWENHYQTAWQNDFYKLVSGKGNAYNVSVKTDKKFRKISLWSEVEMYSS